MRVVTQKQQQLLDSLSDEQMEAIRRLMPFLLKIIRLLISIMTPEQRRLLQEIGEELNHGGQ